MYLLDLDQIELGDIILTRSSERESILIRQLTKSNYSHALIYVGSSSYIESNGLGVQSNNLQRLLFENTDDVVVLRLREENLKSLLPGVVAFARQKIGTEYSTSEAKLALLEKDILAKEENRQFCTRFVAQAYLEAGIKIVNNPDYCTPQEILESQELVIIDGLARKAMNKEIEFALNKNNPLEKQIAIHNYIFENARNITGCDIQTFDQLGKYVLENLKRENEIIEIIEKSGYLEMWKIDVERNPWHYDYKDFLKHYPDPKQRKHVGYHLVITEKEIRERFYITLDTHKCSYSFYEQKYFKIFIELYKRLIELSEERKFVGLLALKN